MCPEFNEIGESRPAGPPPPLPPAPKSQAEQNTEAKMSVFIFNTPADQQNGTVARKLMAKFDMRKAKLSLPDQPQTYSYLYLLTDDKPAGFPALRTFNFNEVNPNVTSTAN